MQKVESGPESKKKKFRPWLNFSNPSPTVTPLKPRYLAQKLLYPTWSAKYNPPTYGHMMCA